MLCEICGEKGAIKRVFVEGATVTVCEKCSRFGREVRTLTKETAPRPRADGPEIVVVEKFAELVRKNREALGWTQKELAKKINERESIIVKIENNRMSPDINTAKKLEVTLKIKLLATQENESGTETKGRQDEALTLGDVIKVKSARD